MTAKYCPRIGQKHCDILFILRSIRPWRHQAVYFVLMANQRGEVNYRFHKISKPQLFHSCNLLYNGILAIPTLSKQFIPYHPLKLEEGANADERLQYLHHATAAAILQNTFRLLRVRFDMWFGVWPLPGHGSIISKHIVLRPPSLTNFSMVTKFFFFIFRTSQVLEKQSKRRTPSA